MDLRFALTFVLVAVSVASVAWVILPYLTGEIRAERRTQDIARRDATRLAAAKPRDAAMRRTQVAESMKELEDRQKRRKNPSLNQRLDQAGLEISRPQFFLFSAVAAVILGLAVMVTLSSPIYGLAAAFAGGLGFPRWFLSYRRKKRQQKFLDEFPNAIDAIVRGVKAGLPLADSLRIVSTESQEPVRSEFKQVIELQTVGVPVAEACEKLYERVGVTEANFFGIVIAIQQKTGGSLADTLGNLSKVLRDRKKMQAKIKAVSMEAKASASIIGSLPIVIMVLVYLTSPDYIELLWTQPLGQVMLGCSAFWMFCGVMVMRKMINFDF
ncbi:pilus assembly protein [Agaricicola taiwanensis]|uniref:Pilus assembly protein n=1 Tax=Agaricicola taiwanensis TaxID=591372 RepID=A0A8J2VMG1_9RHOB|nr:type II secretion system F family protein [Agaricicola taiwanensis]GGE33217.1 pilus assembly protein [Agaricicola taiwanensis]